MTFNQWCANARLQYSPTKIALEAIWIALINGGMLPKDVGHLFDELMLSVRESRR